MHLPVSVSLQDTIATISIDIADAERGVIIIAGRFGGEIYFSSIINYGSTWDVKQVVFSNGNINDGSVNCAVIVSRQADEKTGGIYTTATSSEEDISLENNILKITAGTWWVRVCIKKL